MLWFDFTFIDYSIACMDTQKVNSDMSSINSKKREAGKFNKRCLTLDEKIKILDELKKRKSCRDIAEEFKIGKTQAANAVKNKAKKWNEWNGMNYIVFFQHNNEQFTSFNFYKIYMLGKKTYNSKATTD